MPVGQELKKSKAELVRVAAEDGLMLPGLLFKARGDSVALFLHGTGNSSVFYQDTLMNAFASSLADQGISFFTFNNRGAHHINKLWNERLQVSVPAGMAYENINECTWDINGVLDFLKSRGFKKFYAIGVSSGANKICLYNYKVAANCFSKYVLIAGGDDIGHYYQTYGRERYQATLKYLEDRIQEGAAKELVPKKYCDNIMSIGSLFEIMNPNGDYNVFPFHKELLSVNLGESQDFKFFSSIDKPTLVVYGEGDQFCYGDVDRAIGVLMKNQNKQNNQISYEIISNGGHYFISQEALLAKKTAYWLSRGREGLRKAHQ